jgi:hypothetical protein
MSYLNNFIINFILTLSLLIELRLKNDIVDTKNAIFCLTVLTSAWHTYFAADRWCFIVVILSALSSMVVHYFRYHLVGGYSHRSHLPLTWLLHFFVMSSLYVTSMTAQYPLGDNII